MNHLTNHKPLTRKSHYYPWRTHNTALFLVDGIHFFPAMLKAIEQAQRYILMEMYLFESGKVADQFITSFINAAKRDLTIQILVDGFGGLGLSQFDRQRMIKAGIQLVDYNPIQFKKFKNNLFRTHRKLLIIDGQKVFIGGMGITDNFDTQKGWRETVVEINGSVVKDWQCLFTTNFKKWSNTPFPELIPLHPPLKGNVTGRVAYTSGGKHLEIKKSLLSRIYNSQHKIWLASAYFIPSRRIRRFMRKAARRGRDVRLLLPGPVTDHPAIRYASRRYYARLLRHGVRIFEYQDRFSHTKMVLIDNWFSIGSSNMDRWNFRWNLEANQEIKDDPETIARAHQILCNDFEHSQEIRYEEWKQRSLLQRFIEWFWGRIDLLLTGQR